MPKCAPEDFFVYNTPSKREELENFLASRVYNVINDDIRDKNDRAMVGLSFTNDHRRQVNRGLILIKNDDLLDEVMDLVETYMAVTRLTQEG